jgi:leucyl aminopeptidase (aminopeptidase T)|tara:strand:+ start:790 stop:1740 length:951 start_codon:yes stop_codon:yes gene_type:complete
MTELQKAANIVLKECMNFKESESLLIVFDENKKSIVDVLLKVGKEISSNVNSIEIPVGKIHGEEPPSEVAQEMKKYDIILLITTKSLSHTDARRNACKGGARGASMPGITEDMMERTLNADYVKISAVGDQLKEKLAGEKVRVVTKLGTDLVMEMNKLFDDNGLYHEKGSFGNLPAGEIGFAPVEGKTNGTFVVDQTLGGIGRLKAPIKFTVKDGSVVDIEGEEEAKDLKKRLMEFKDSSVYNVAELAIGTNDKAKITGFTLEDEKVIGTVHIAIGDNTSFPGGTITAPVHLDGILSEPTVYVDDAIIMENGKLLI